MRSPPNLSFKRRALRVVSRAFEEIVTNGFGLLEASWASAAVSLLKAVEVLLKGYVTGS